MLLGFLFSDIWIMSNPIFFLHGAIGASDQLKSLAEKFQNAFLFDFPGHGGKAFPDEAFSIHLFAESLLQEMENKKIERADFFGYSMGGYVALYLARHYPGRVGKIMTLGTKFAWDEMSSAKEVKMLDPGKIAEKVPKFAAALEKRHAPLDWKEVLSRTAGMMLALGKNPELSKEDFAQIKTPVLLSVGDSDTMVSLEETIGVYRQIEGAQLAVHASTVHPIEQVDEGRLVELGERFF